MSRVQIHENGQVLDLDLILDAETLAAILAPWSAGASGVAPDSDWMSIATNAQHVQARARSPFLAAVAARFRAHPKCRAQTEAMDHAKVSAVTAILSGEDGFVCVKIHAPVSGRPFDYVPVHAWTLTACEFPARDPDHAFFFRGVDINALFRDIDDFLTCGVPANTASTSTR